MMALRDASEIDPLDHQTVLTECEVLFVLPAPRFGSLTLARLF